MPLLNDRVMDNGLTVLDTEANRLHLCTSEPTTFAGAATASLGNFTLAAGDITLGAGSPNGRQANVLALSGANATATGTASHYAITDTVNSRLLATSSLSATQSITSGNPITTTAFNIRIPAAV